MASVIISNILNIIVRLKKVKKTKTKQKKNLLLKKINC